MQCLKNMRTAALLLVVLNLRVPRVDSAESCSTGARCGNEERTTIWRVVFVAFATFTMVCDVCLSCVEGHLVVGAQQEVVVPNPRRDISVLENNMHQTL